MRIIIEIDESLPKLHPKLLAELEKMPVPEKLPEESVAKPRNQ